jgi:hypothetical protein
MNIAERAQRICLSPDSEWAVIAGESAALPALITGYVLPLAALSAIGSFVGSLMLGLGLGLAVRAAIVGLVFAIIGVVLLSAIIDALAPTFGAAKNRISAAQVAAYAPTPAWVAGLFGFVPIVGSLISLIGALYALYLLYLGLMRVMKSPADKAVSYTAVVVLITLVVGVVVSYLTATIGLGAAVAAMQMSF